jgi:hypothetical protein
MYPDDVVLFEQAKQLVNSGQKQAAYSQLCAIRANGNDYDPDLLLWISFTSPSQPEAQQALDTASRIAPDHLGLPAARAYQNQQWQQQAHQYSQQQYGQQQQYAQQQYMQYPPPQYAQQAYIPLLPPVHCPYCRAYAPPLVKRRISTAGWIVFAVLLFFTFIFCWIGLLIKEDYRVCSYCGAQIG